MSVGSRQGLSGCVKEVPQVETILKGRIPRHFYGNKTLFDYERMYSIGLPKDLETVLTYVIEQVQSFWETPFIILRVKYLLL